MKFIPPVQRIDRGKTHFYVDGDQKRIPGVTTILDAGLPKPQLINWAANATAEGALNNWDTLTELPPAARLKTLQGIRYEVTNKAKNKGTQIHAYAADLVAGHQVTGIPDELRPYVEHYVRFIDTWQLDPILVEVVVVSYTHGYAGTLDLVADLTGPTGQRERYLLDIKTGEKGIYAETALQLAAYRFSEFYVDQDGNEQPMIPVEHTGAIHVTADDAQLIPTVSERDQLTTFRIAQKIYEYDKDKDGLILPALQLPTGSTARIIWENADA
jgi:hypothetical protein